MNQDEEERDTPKGTSPIENTIKKHTEEMESEIRDWTSMYHQMKSKRKELEKFSNDLNVIQFDQSYLTEADIKFLKESPDYRGLTSKMNDLANRVLIAKKGTALIKTKVNGNIAFINRAVQHTKLDIAHYLLNVDESACNDFEFL